MTSISDQRNIILRRLYGKMLADASEKHSAKSILWDLKDPTVERLVPLIVKGLVDEGLILERSNIDGGDVFITLTASGIYEAERLGGKFEVPATAKILNLLKDHQVLGLILTAVSIAVTIAYPEIKEWWQRVDYIYSECIESGLPPVSSEFCESHGYTWEEWEAHQEKKTAEIQAEIRNQCTPITSGEKLSFKNWEDSLLASGMSPEKVREIVNEKFEKFIQNRKICGM